MRFPSCRELIGRWLGALALVVCFAATPSLQAYTGVETTHRVRFYWTDTYNSIAAVDIDLFGEASPRHVANFLRYVDAGAYDDSYIHRSQSGSARFLQGGSFHVPNPFAVAALGDYPIPAAYRPVKNEFDTSNGLSNITGTLAAARMSNPDSATVGWFFNVTDNSGGFDPGPSGPYTVFGEVTSGWDAFAALASQPILKQIQPKYSNENLYAFATAPLLPGLNGNYFVPTLLKWTRAPLLPGDFNLDGVVDAADEAVWQMSQGDFGTANLVADANGDGVVDQADRAIWQANLGMGELKNVAGDYNGNGVLTEADYLWWKTHFGADDIFDADGNGDGKVDALDYLVWRNNFEAAGGLLAPPMATVPEPASMATFGGLIAFGWLLRKKKRASNESDTR